MNKKTDVSPMEYRGYTLRLAKEEDAQRYYEENFTPLEPEVARLTGSRTDFSKEEVMEFFCQCVVAEDRYDFLIISPEGNIIGESVINEIDWELRSANFRICIFHSRDCGNGIGGWVVAQTRDFAFGTLKLHRLELDVFSFNERAQKAYLKAGFKQEGVLRDAIRDGENYADDIIMAMLEKEWREKFA